MPELGRIIARFGQHSIIATDDGHEYEAVRRGKRLDAVVGDRVSYTLHHGSAAIEAIEPRRNLLYREDAERTKPLAANVDQVAIVFAPQPAPQREFLWRAMLACAAADVDALLVLNKIDIESPTARTVFDEACALGARGLCVSAKTQPAEAYEALDRECRGRVTLFVGHSGVGKSSLLSLLLGERLRVGELSQRSGQGKQTTTATRWYPYGDDGALIDSPGFQSFGLHHLNVADLPEWMPDFAAAPGACRFADCRHLEEPDCRIRSALAAGTIAPERHAFYRRLLDERESTPRSPRR